MAVALYPWQKTAFEQWKTQALGRPAQAYLLMATPGHGAENFARAMVQALLCEQGGCGRCTGCQQLAAVSHPDFFELTLPAGKKEIPVDAVRELAGWAVETPHHVDGLKVVWLHPVEKLSLSAANALLKTLEEPPADVVFILQSSGLGDVLPTIRSRCQLLRAPQASREAAFDWLKSSLPDVSDKQIHVALEKHFYAPVTARVWLASGGWQAYEAWREQMMQLSQGRIDLVSVAEAWSKLDDPGEPLRWLLSWSEQQLRANPQRKKMIALQRAIYKGLAALEGNANVQLVLEQVLVTHVYGE